MTEKINPWDLFLNDTPFDNEIAFRSLFALTSSKRVADTLHRIQNRRLQDPDYEMRDIIFTGRKQEEFEHPNLFHYAKEHYKGMKSFDSAIKYDAIMKECVRRKYFYWKSHTKTKPESKEKHESQQRIYEAIRAYKLPSQLFFTLAGFGVSYILGLYKNKLSFRVVAVGAGIAMGTLFGEFRYATNIFDSIQPLPDKEWEEERRDIYNYCFSLDIKQIANALHREEEGLQDDPNPPAATTPPSKK